VFAPFLAIPGKDNGLDIEGLGVWGQRIFVGLRGPVLRGWAVVLETEWEDSNAGEMSFATPLRKHLLDLEGLGVRSLALHGSDIYILAGPTMDLDGPVFVFRWPKALQISGEAVVPRERLRKLLAVPFGTGEDAGRDHAEGISLIARKGRPPHVMICYDSPAEARLVGKRGIRLDVFKLSKKDLDH
jgi:hypothetical protein